MSDSKSMTERIIKAFNELTDKGFLDRDAFREANKITDRTFRRFIAIFQSNVVPLSYDEATRVYTKDDAALLAKMNSDIIDKIEKLRAKNDLLLFYCFVKSMVESRYFIPPIKPESGTPLDTNFDEIVKVIKDVLPIEQLEFSEKIEYYISEYFNDKSRSTFRVWIDLVIKSFKTKRLLSFEYDNGTGEMTKVVIEPMKLVYYNGKWYIIGYRTEKNGSSNDCGVIRTYNLSLIDKMILTKSGYPQKDNAYSLEFKDSFGFFMDKNKKNAVIRFSGKVVREVSNIKWTAVQKTKNNPEDKSCEFKLEYPASGSRELILKVLSYGADAEVIAPEELRQEWLAEISRLSAYMTKKSKK